MVEWKKLGEVCSLKARIGWQGLTQKEHKTTGEYLLVTGTDFTANYGVNFDHCVYVDEERYTQDPNIQLRQNDVLITKDGTLGKMAVIENLPKPATLNGGLFVIRDLTGKIHHKYLLHYMLSSKFQSIIDSNHTNGTIKHLTQALLTNFPIPIPTLEIQLEIVRILDTFTASIDNLKEQIAQRRKQYEYYRDQLLDLEGKEGVEMKLLSSISTIKVGPFGSLIHKKDYVSGGIPLVNPVQMNNGYIVRDDSFSVSEETAKLLESYTLYTGDVVFARRGEIGRCAIVTENESNFICGTGSLIVRFKDIINSKFMLFMFNTPYCKTYLLKSAVGGSMLNINCDIVGKMQIPVPPLSEQQRIVSILDTFEASIQNLEAQLSQREKQYDYYRNKLLTFE